MTGRDVNVNVNVNVNFAAFSLRTKRSTLICIYMVTVTRYFCLHLGKKTSTSVLLSGYVCSYIKTNGVFQYQTRTTDWFDIFFSRMHFVRVF